MGGPAYDPSSLALTGWWRADYTGVPWVGTSSAGPSGTSPGRDLEAGNVGGGGALASGRVPFLANGASTYLVGHTGLTWADLVGAGDFYVHAVVRWNTAPAPVSAIDDPAIFTDNGGAFGLSVSSAGVQGFVYDQSGTPQLRTVGPVAASSGSLHLIQWWWDSAAFTMWLQVDGGTPLRADLFDSTFGGANAITAAASWNLVAFLDGDLFEVMTAQSKFDAATRLALRGYATDRYGGAFGWWDSTTDYVRGAPVGRMPAGANRGPARRRAAIRDRGVYVPGPSFVATGIARSNQRRPAGPFAEGPMGALRPLRTLSTFASVPGPRFVALGSVPRVQVGLPMGVGRYGPRRVMRPTTAYLPIAGGGGGPDQSIALASVASGEAFAPVAILPADALVAIAGLASSEAVGSIALAPGATTLGIAPIDTGEMRGPVAFTTLATLGIAPIGSAERRGPLGLAPGAIALAVGGLRTGERRGPLGLAPATVTVPLAGLRSSEARGPVAIATMATVAIAGVRTVGAVGPLVLAPTATVAVGGVRSAERRGPLALAPGGAALALAGLGTGERRGPLVLAPGASSVALAGVWSGERVGFLALVASGALDQSIALASVRSAERRGPLAFSVAPITVAIAGVRSAERAGPLALAPATLTVAVGGVRSAEARAPVVLALGASTVALAGVRTGERRGPVVLASAASALALAGLRTGERRGPLVLAAGASALALAGVLTSERRGPLGLVPGAIALAVGGLRTGERRGPVTLTATATVAVGGVRSGERRGPLGLAPATVTVPLAGLRSSAAVGPLALAPSVVVQLAGARSGERLGPLAPTIPLVLVAIHLEVDDARPWLSILSTVTSPWLEFEVDDARPWLELADAVARPWLEIEPSPAEPWLRVTSEIPPMPQINIGDDAAPVIRVRNPDGDLVDPSTVSLVVRAPSGASTTYVYPCAQIEKVAVGIYRARIPITASGTWRYRWVFASPNGTEPAAFNVPADEF